MNVDEVVWRIRNEPEWLILGGVAFLLIIGVSVYFTGFTGDQQAEAQQAFNSAYANYQQSRRSGDFQSAIQQLNQVMGNYPNSKVTDKALFFLGKAYMQQGETLEAMRQFQSLIDDYPRSFFYEGALLNLAYGAQERGELQQARKFLQDLLDRVETGPIRQEALWQKAMIELEENQNNQARETLSALIDQAEDEDSFWTERARQLRAIIPS